jgi:hypothetical protein
MIASRQVLLGRNERYGCAARKQRCVFRMVTPDYTTDGFACLRHEMLASVRQKASWCFTYGQAMAACVSLRQTATAHQQVTTLPDSFRLRENRLVLVPKWRCCTRLRGR